ETIRNRKLSLQKEIAKRRQLHDELESDNSSGSKVHYNIEYLDESPKGYHRENSKVQEAAREEGNDDAEEIGDEDTEVEESVIRRVPLKV
ncbi:hypothetical protein HAX54_038845, partial [Datura stramonium]|nr:hypothetical protein [Datura stramonium]